MPFHLRRILDPEYAKPTVITQDSIDVVQQAAHTEPSEAQNITTELVNTNSGIVITVEDTSVSGSILETIHINDGENEEHASVRVGLSLHLPY